MDPIAGPVFLSVLERLSARLLSLDPRTLEAARAMAGKVIAVELLGLGKTVYFAPGEHRFELLDAYSGDVHVRVRGTPLALLRMARGEETAGFSGEVEIIGDLRLGRHLQSMLASFDIDWEELLSQYLGDIAAHQIGNVVRDLSGWAEKARHALALDTVEYLRNEAGVLVEKHDIAEFVDAVDALRNDVDRLEARLQRVARALGPRRD
ncbi:MAG: ubiquinone biosynthesis accessory factor UbiJ [Gammaproteobacteria bacterium]